MKYDLIGAHLEHRCVLLRARARRYIAHYGLVALGRDDLALAPPAKSELRLGQEEAIRAFYLWNVSPFFKANQPRGKNYTKYPKVV